MQNVVRGVRLDVLYPPLTPEYHGEFYHCVERAGMSWRFSHITEII